MKGISYLSEILAHRRTVLAAAVVTGSALALNLYVGSLFIPSLAEAFGWKKSQFAIMGTLGLLSLFSFPFWGRMADRFGSRSVSLLGVLVVPGCFFLYSLMTGEIWQYYAIYGLLALFGAAASTPILARVLVNRIATGRGLALAILMAGPPIIGGIAAPLLNEIIANEGWRSAYRILAACTLVFGLSAWTFVPADTPQMIERRPNSIKDYKPALKSPAFWVVVIGMFLCNFGNILSTHQLAPLLLYNKVSPTLVGGLVSLYAGSVVAGRFLCGFALDRFSTANVAFFCMGLPAIGLLMLWGGPDTLSVIAIAVALVGISQGAEGDIGGFAAARYLGPSLFGLTYGFITGVAPAASAVGAFVLSAKLAANDSFGPFVLITAILTVIGAIALLALGRFEPVPEGQGDVVTQP